MYLKLMLLLQMITFVCYHTIACGSNTTTLIPTSSNWLYNDSGNNLGTSWRATGYNDSSWNIGIAELGYGDGGENSPLNFGGNYNNKHITYYFRKSFNIADINAVANGADLGILRDDGAVVYLNGIEIYRTNMPNGNISYNTTASSSTGGSDENKYFTTSVASSAFVQGTNVIAVEVHQRSKTSSDVSFNLELCAVNTSGGNQPNILRGPYLQKATTNSVVVKWRTDAAASSKVFYGTSPSSLNQSVQSLSQVNNHEIEVTGLNPNTIYYYAVGTTTGQIVGGDSEHYFNTHPPIGTPGNYRMWVLGDAGTANNNQRAVRNAFQSYNGSNHTDMILMLGDNAYNSGTDSEYQNAVFNNMYEDLLINSVLWSCPGNHDYYGGADAQTQTGVYYDIFTFPKNGESGGLASGTEAYYSFDYGNIHIVSLDSHDSDRNQGGSMITWLANDLSQTTQEWLVVIFHHPPYTKGSHNSDIETQLIEMRQNALPVMEQHGVDLVLSGHSHSYERSKLIQGHYGHSSSFDECTMLVDGGGGRPDQDSAYLKVTESTLAGNGSIYITAGSSGKISGGDLNHPVMYSSLNELGSVIVDVIGDSLAVKFLNSTGSTTDYFSIVKKSLGSDYDTDGDSYSDSIECPSGFPCIDTDDDCIPDFKDTDSDGDGIPDISDACRLEVGTVANMGCVNSNLPPVANDDSFYTIANNPVGGDMSTNDTDPNGNTLIYNTIPIVFPLHGIVNINVNGSFGYTPNYGYTGLDSLVYEVCDNAPIPLCNQATVSLTILNGGNTPPIPLDDEFTTMVNTNLSGNVTDNDYDPSGHNLTVTPTPVSGTTNGTLTLNIDGTFLYVPSFGFNGTDSFEYQICDTGSPVLCSNANVTIIVSQQNEYAPIALNDVYNIGVGNVASGNVTDNDSDQDGNNLIVSPTPLLSPTNGTLVLNTDGTFIYTPSPTFNGMDTFIYEVCDDGVPSFCSIASVTITNTSTNQAPIAVDDTGSTTVETAVSGNVLTNDSDPDNNNLVINSTPVVSPANGNLNFNSSGVFSYTPYPEFIGIDSFEYEVCDDGVPVLCDQAVVTITVSSTNQAPIAVDDTGSTTVETTVSGNVLTNDSDPDNDNLTLTMTPITGPSSGTVILFSSNGNYAYTPYPEFIGIDSFEYELCDDGVPVLCDQAVVTITVSSTNQAPIAVDDASSTTVETAVSGNVLTNDSDPDNNNLVINSTPVVSPANGNLNFNSSGVFSYTPYPEFMGIDSFEYEVCDDGVPVLCDQAVVTITVSTTNQAPIAVDDTGSTTVETAVSGNVLTNDNDPDNDNLTLTMTPITGPSSGTVILFSSNGNYTYTPYPEFIGIDSFEYELCDDGVPVLCDQAVVTVTVSSTNQAPIAVDDTGSTTVETTVSGNVLTNDSDPDNNNLVINSTPVVSPANGNLNFNSSGVFSYTPYPEFIGIDSFEYELCDDGVPVLCDQAVVTITVSANNQAPIAVDDTGSTTVETTVSGNVLTNDSDPDNDNLTLTMTPVTGPSSGTVILFSSNGNYAYTPYPEFMGIDSFEYELCDDGVPVLCDQAVVTITVSSTNQAPIAVDDASSTAVETAVSGNVLTNDSDPDNNNLVINSTPVVSPANGNLNFSSNGNYTYTPYPEFMGIDSFEYELCDDGVPVLCDQAVVTITVSSTNQAPIAVDDTGSTTVETTVSGNVLTNDSDPNNDNLVINSTPVVSPANGNLNFNSSGVFSYTPYPEFMGIDSFEYEVCDDGVPVLCDQAVVTITISSDVNLPPIAVDDYRSTSYNVGFYQDLFLNDSDPNGDDLVLTTTPLINASNGVLTLNSNGLFIYTPQSGYIGMDSFMYEVCDNGIPALCDTATVFITMTTNNNYPIAVDDNYSTPAATPVTDNVSSNDSDPDGHTLSVVTTPVEAPTLGNVVINADGTFTYTPTINLDGVDAFSYRICDNGGPSLCDTAIVEIVIGTGNTAPTAINDSIYTDVDTPISGNIIDNDLDINEDDLMVNPNPLSNTTNGTLVLSSDGTFNYTPDPGFSGEDQFVYEVCDDGVPVLCSIAIVIITVESTENSSPIATDDGFTGLEDNILNDELLTNDEDPDGDQISINLTPTEDVSNGVLVLYSDGSFDYTPNPDYNGIDSFQYEICDNGTPTLCDSSIVTLTINAVNDAPITINDTITTIENTAINIPILDNDSDVDGNLDPATVTLISQPLVAQGTVVVNPNGSITFTPANGFSGMVNVFYYQICDDGTPVPVKCEIAGVLINVVDTNDPPVAENDAYTGPEDTVVSGNVLNNDSDINEDQLIVSSVLVSPPSSGMVVINPDGTFNYTPSLNFYGEDSFAYEVCDDVALSYCDTAIVNITIEPVNDAPIPQSDIVTTDEDVQVPGNAFGNDMDPDGDNIVATTTPTTLPVGGSVTLNSNGIFIYTPNPDFNGVDAFSYEVCDDQPIPLCAISTVTIIINPINDPPIVVSDSTSTMEDTPITIQILDNDSDVDGNIALSSITTPPASEGTVVINPDGSIIFTPASGFTGNVSPITYFVCDDGFPTPVECSSGTIIIVVIPENRPPVANPDNYSGEEDLPLTGNVLDNDSDPNAGDILTVNTTSLVSPVNGGFVLNADGTFMYTPDAGFIGQDSFVYTVCDNGNPVKCADGTVIINIVDCPIVSFNDPTICQGETVLMIADDAGIGAGYSWDFGPNANPQFSNSKIESVTFNITGSVSVTLTVSLNNCVRTITKTISIDEEPIADAGPDIYLCRGDTAILGGTPSGPQGAVYYWTPINGILSANTGENPLVSPTQTTTFSVFVTIGSCTSVDETTVFVLDRPNATAGPDNFICEGDSVMIGDLNGPRPGATYSWNPTDGLSNPNVCNPKASPSEVRIYTVTTTVNGCSNTDDVLIEVAPAPNASAGPNVGLCDENNIGVVLGNPGNDPFAIYEWTPNLYLNDQNSPNPVAKPPSTFTYTMTAIKFGCPVEEQVTVIVGGCQFPPVAVNDTLTMMEDETILRNIMSNDYSSNGKNLQINPTLLVSASHGVVSVTANGGLTYTPDPNFFGIDSLLYVLCDDNVPVLCDTGFVMMNIAGVNDGPISQQDQMSTTVDVMITGNVLDNDSDPENDMLYINMASLELPSNGTLVMNADGLFDYIPDVGFEGVDKFRYEVCDEGIPNICVMEEATLIVGNCMDIRLAVLLEGAYDQNSQEMLTTLNTVRKILPGQTPSNDIVAPTTPGQPYNLAPWNYMGIEGIDFTDADYSPDVVDWILISLRTTPEKGSEVWKTAALVLKDGTVEFVKPCFPDLSAQGPFYIVIEHRNHMGIMTEQTVPVVNRRLDYDFRLEDTYRDLTSFGQVQVLPGIYAMYAADGNQVSDVISYDITGVDKILWAIENGIFDEYRSGDFNMDGDVTGVDKILWAKNNGLSSRVLK